MLFHYRRLFSGGNSLPSGRFQPLKDCSRTPEMVRMISIEMVNTRFTFGTSGKGTKCKPSCFRLKLDIASSYTTLSTLVYTLFWWHGIFSIVQDFLVFSEIFSEFFNWFLLKYSWTGGTFFKWFFSRISTNNHFSQEIVFCPGIPSR